ncbi:MAG: DUF192 domain-containing protein [Nitrospirae bacterium]|nr:DUF192 domain-containing protein [Nitrospirota bacterium]
MILWVLLIAAFPGCSSASIDKTPPPPPPELPEVFESMETKSINFITERGEEITLDARFAASAVQQAAGYQNVPAAIIQKTFILFVFAGDHTSPFHMRNVLASLDIFFLDSAGKVVSLQRMDPDPQRLWSAGGTYRYALEGPAGFASERGLGADSHLELPLP